MSIRDYTLIRSIGEGGFAKVFLAKRLGKNSKFVAIKVQKKEEVHRSNWHKKVALNEVEVLKKAIGKSFLSQICAAFVDLESYYTVLELYEGGDLHTFINRSGYKPNKNVWSFVAMSLLNGLDQLNNIGVIHNDFKPENVLINKSGYLFISDFGLSVIAPFDISQKGTPGYIAPECHGVKAKYTSAADYFSLGVILYELSEKKHPFQSIKELSKVSPALKIDNSVWLFVSSLLEVDPANGTRSLDMAMNFGILDQKEFESISNHAFPSPIISYVEKHPIIEKIEMAYDFVRVSSPKQQDKSIQCTLIPVDEVEEQPESSLAVDFKCREEGCNCNNQFINIKTLQQHKRDVHNITSQKYKCNECLKCFSRNERLQTHLEMHKNPAKKVRL